jgi:hypothetical protein
MLTGKQTRCPDCDDGVFEGNGRCSRCHGSGINLNLASDAPKCLYCDGSGVCATCDGSGLYPPQREDSIIHTLFN